MSYLVPPGFKAAKPPETPEQLGQLTEAHLTEAIAKSLEVVMAQLAALERGLQVAKGQGQDAAKFLDGASGISE